ncbi:peptide deformylase [Kribbella amoyensis]|uniref:Peptide deformylase n=1 Tax=Kribbella amoyensis TaxID=996641 RepID=A0A561BYP3_9ACTN|nr:peptide deformylase [Kribbella amoyensis]TWD83812.1 peptide deformylase [Kribbella amoyensis]
MRITRRTLLAGTATAPLTGLLSPRGVTQGVTPQTMTGATTIKDAITGLLDKYGDEDGVAPIVSLGDPVLRQPAALYDGQVDDQVLSEFVALLRRTMLTAPGVGGAAPQVGIPIQVAVLEDPAPVSAEVAEARQRYPLEFFAVVNPEYAALDGRRRGFFEGCLSMPGYTGVVNRHLAVEATYFDPAGTPQRRELTGWQARIFQHETDHLGGTVYVDKVETRSLCTTQNYLDHWDAPVPARAAEVLGFELA